MNGFYPLAARAFFKHGNWKSSRNGVFFFMGKSWTFYFPWWGQSIAMFDWRVAPSDWEKLPVISP
jgi:hypothetical protein